MGFNMKCPECSRRWDMVHTIDELEALQNKITQLKAEWDKSIKYSRRLEEKIEAINADYDDVCIEINQLKAERDELKTTLFMMGSCYVDDREDQEK